MREQMEASQIQEEETRTNGLGFGPLALGSCQMSPNTKTALKCDPLRLFPPAVVLFCHATAGL